jgi:imidazolonepropionase-like amidohydrolase
MRHAAIAAISLSALAVSPTAAVPADVQGEFTIHEILHAIGTETFYIAANADGTRTMTSTYDTADRGRRNMTTATLTLTADERPLALEVKSGAATTSVVMRAGTMTIQMRGVTSTVAATPNAAAVIGASPFALQAMMMRAWHARGEPRQMSPISANPNAEPLEIVRVGRDTITAGGRTVALDRYTVDHLMFGREIVWTTADGELAAAMTFAGGLPLEAVRTEFEPAFPALYRAGVAQEMANLAEIGRRVPPSRSGAFAISGATLITGVAAPALPDAIPDAVVIVRNGRIAAAGPRDTTPIPAGMPVVDARGQTILAGLWEMHTHASGVEFGPAHLAAGITTARDCGGEFDFLVAERDAIEKRGAIGPRQILAGLIDAGGAKAFGHVTAETPEEGRAVVRRYHAAGFQQVKLYTFLTPDVITAIADEAHRLGMTVTGHVPQSVSTMAGIEAGMDQINHLNYVTSMLREPGGARGGGAAPPVDFGSATAQAAIRFLLDHHTVVDPTASWGEMASHSRDIELTSFEPGILQSPAVLEAKFRGMESATTADQARARMAQTLNIIRGLHRAGVPIVAGSDTGLVGFGLHRELELYAQAGMTPLEVIQSATIVSARAMGLDNDTGTVERGKRADLILIDGDPLQDIRALRNVRSVIANGRMYDAGALWQSVGFRARK